MATASISTPRVDIYSRVTNHIVEQLAQGIRPWMQPWNAEHAAGRIIRVAHRYALQETRIMHGRCRRRVWWTTWRPAATP